MVPVPDPGREAIPAALAAATGEQPAARAALAGALRSGPAHAYALVGPSGSGKAAAARALAAEILALGAPDPDRARRRALADPSSHPDLTWLRPPGNQHLVEEVRERVIGAVDYRPFEGERRVFVIEAADAMAEESQNALLKTLEEPPSYAHLILITAEPSALLPTVRSRCAEVGFAPLSPAALGRRLEAELPAAEPELREALALLSGGDLGRALLLGSRPGAQLRELAERSAEAARHGGLEERPWGELVAVAAEAGKERAAVVTEATERLVADLGEGRERTRIMRQGEEAAKRAERRARTEAIDLAIALAAAWFADLAAVAEGVPGLVRNADRRPALERAAAGLEASAARRAAEEAMAIRRRLRVNVNEELALDALFHRAASLLGGSARID